MFKILCIVLIAVVFVEANPTIYDENGKLTPMGERLAEARKTFNDWFANVIETKRTVINNLGESIRQTVSEDAKAVENGIASSVDAGKGVLNAIGKVADAKIAFVTSAPKVFIDTYNKIVSPKQ